MTKTKTQPAVQTYSNMSIKMKIIKFLKMSRSHSYL